METVDLPTRLGVVRGVERMGVHTFWGLRFAQPARRFCEPERATPWEGVWDATTMKAMAPQRPLDATLAEPPDAPMDEDCLYLNVHVPATPCTQPRPVLFFVHGGAFVGGAANQYDGSALAAGADAVVVCTNYRLGLLGFTDVSSFGPEQARSVDLWLLDCLEALRWVRDNIADYGGDPGCVTVMGESAGAAATVALVSAPAARGLLHRAMANSAGMWASVHERDVLTEIAAKTRRSPDQVKQVLRHGTTAEVLALQGKHRTFQPNAVAGTPLLPSTPEALIAQRGPDAVPLVIGYATHEGAIVDVILRKALHLRWPATAIVKRLVARKVAIAAAGGKTRVKRYLRGMRAVHPGPLNGERVEAVWTDGARRASVDFAQATTEAGSAGYVYCLDVPCILDGRKVPSTHGADLELTFNLYGDPDSKGFAIIDHPLAPELGKKWVAMLAQFARTGDPGGPLGDWPAYDAETRVTLRVTPEGGVVEKHLERAYREKVWNA